MKTKLVALCAAAALLLTACADGAAAAQTLQNRKKQVVLYTTQTDYNEDGTEASRVVVDYRYDEQGNLLGMDNYDGCGSRWEYVYNGDGVMVSQVFYDPAGQLQSTRSYDLDGNLTRIEGTGSITYADGTTEPYTTTSAYTYDELGRLLEMLTTENGEESLHETWTYDDAAHTGTCKTVETRLWGLLKGNVFRRTDEMTFNEDWQVLTSHRSAEGGNSPLDEVYTYDEAGNEISHRTVINDSVSEVVSTYDEDGNLLRATSTQNGTLEYEVVSTLGTLNEALQRQQNLAVPSASPAA